MATDNKTSVLIDSLLPDFLDTEGPKFQTFVKAYYEWMEQTGQMTDQSKNVLTNQDIDLAAEKFLKYFKREILSKFPEDILADKRLVYKRIKDLYRSKGSEESYKLLFRILYNEELDFYYPGQDILRASDGRWVKETSLRVTQPFTGNIENLAGEITGQSSSATAKVERVQNNFDDSIYFYEIFITNINGTFIDGETITNTAGTISGTVVSSSGSLQNVIILDGGSGHQKNDLVTITSASGSGGRGTINVTSNGAIVTLAVTNAGSNFVRTDPLTILNTTRAAANATGAGLLTSTINYTGRYNDVKGFLSWSNKLQDNRYYQEYSYVLRSSQVLNTYREIVKDVVHPAGMRLFGDVLINIDIDNTTASLDAEYVLHFPDIIPTDIFIPTVVSASIDQYEESGEDGGIVPLPEIEIEQIESFFDIDVADSNGEFQVEIELIAAQTSALLDADEIISTLIVRLIENVSVNTISANTVGDVQLANVAEPGFINNYSNTFVWFNANGYPISPADAMTELDSPVTVGLHRIGLHAILPSIGFDSVNTEIQIYNDLPIYALEDTLPAGFTSNTFINDSRVNIATFSSNTLNNIVADFDTSYPGIPTDWEVNHAPVSYLEASIAFGDLTVETFSNTLIQLYNNYSTGDLILLPTTTVVSANSEVVNV